MHFQTVKKNKRNAGINLKSIFNTIIVIACVPPLLSKSAQLVYNLPLNRHQAHHLKDNYRYIDQMVVRINRMD